MNNSDNTKSLALACAALGAASLIGQTLALRGIMSAVGGSELSVSLTLALWLLFTGLFGWAGSRVPEKWDAFPPVLAVAGLLLPATVLLPVVLPELAGLRAGEAVPAGGVLLVAAASVGAAAPFIGLAFPLAAARQGGARAYALESLGGFAAGLAFTFILAPRLSPLRTALIASILCLVAATLISGRSLRAFCVLSVAAFATLFAFSPQVERRAYETGIEAGRLAYVGHTRYGEIAVRELSGQFSVYTDGEYAFSLPDRDSDEKKAHVPLAVHPAPDRVLVIGGGGTSIVEMLKHPVKRLDYVELDPGLMDVAARYMSPAQRGALSDPRVRVIHKDGRAYLKETGEKYDVIILSAPEPRTAAVNRYFTREFYQEAARVLAPGGMLAFSLPSSANYMDESRRAFVGSVYHTLKSVFPHVGVTPEDTSWSFASMDYEIGLDPAALSARFAARGIDSMGVNEYTLPYFFDPHRTRLVRETLDASPGGLNTDMRPVSFAHALSLWGEVAGTPRPVYAALALAAVLLPLALIMAKGFGNARAAFAVGTSGFAGMAVEVAALLFFQAHYGYLYHAVGLLVALFMLGLYAGSAFGGNSGGERAIAYYDAAFALLPLVLLAAEYTSGAPPGIAAGAVILLAGLFTGAQYRLALALAPEGASGAGRLYGVDLVGSSLGAACAGLFFIPMLGIAWTAASVLVLKGFSAGILKSRG